jgi:SIR2-like domain
MARIHYDPGLSPRTKLRLPPDAIGELPLDLVRTRLKDVQRQRLIPFLGAGASLPPNRPAKPALQVRRPTLAELQSKFHDYNIGKPIQFAFLEAALVIAQLLGHHQHEEAVNLTEAPSSWELANILAQALHIQPFEPYGEALMDLLQDDDNGSPNDNRREICSELVREVARLMGLNRSVPQLLSVASYFNARDRMIGLLYNRFRQVKASNAIHKVLTDYAYQFVDARNKPQPSSNDKPIDKRDFVIITTNYDTLIESELDRAQVPTCIVTVDIATCQVMIDFTENTQTYLGLDKADFETLKKRYREDEKRVLQDISNAAVGPLKDAIFTPKKFTLTNKTHSLAMVYKIHGSLERGALAARDEDGLVISDHDYVEFIQHNGPGNDLIPAYITARLSESRLLFLGYSFSDWNVRGLYRYFLRHRRTRSGTSSPEQVGRERERDFIVMRSFGKTDELFFEQWDVSVMIVDLDTLAGHLNAR